MKQHSFWQTRDFWLDIACDAAGGFLMALGYYTFAENGGFAPGGITGIAMLIRHFSGLPLGMLTLALNVPIVALCLPLLGIKFFGRSIRTMLIGTVFMDLVLPCFPAYQGSQLLSAMFTGVCAGAGFGLVYMRGSSTGGVDFIIAAIKKKKPHMSYGQITMLLDGVVVVAGGIVYQNADAVLYGLVALFATTWVMDRILYGAGSGKLVIAVTDHGEQAAKYIDEMVDRGATITAATGAYTGFAHQMVYCACANNEVFMVRRAIFRADPSAMLMVCEATEVFGEGFHLPEET